MSLANISPKSAKTPRTNRRRVVVTGLGWVTPLGHTIETAWARLLAGESGVAMTTLFDASTFPTKFSAEVRDFNLAEYIGDTTLHEYAGRSTSFALASCAQAWRGALLHRCSDLDLDRVGIYFAGGDGSLDFDAFTSTCLSSWDSVTQQVDPRKWALTAMSRMHAMRELEQEPNLALSHLAIYTGAAGPAFNTLTACAAGAQAIGEAAAILRRGDADIMISGGAHSMIHPFGVRPCQHLTEIRVKQAGPSMPRAEALFSVKAPAS